MIHMTGTGVPPGATPITRAGSRAFLGETELAQFAVAGFRSFPLPPEHAAQASSDPSVEFGQDAGCFHITEVTDPTAQLLIDVHDGFPNSESYVYSQLLLTVF